MSVVAVTNEEFSRLMIWDSLIGGGYQNEFGLWNRNFRINIWTIKRSNYRSEKNRFEKRVNYKCQFAENNRGESIWFYCLMFLAKRRCILWKNWTFTIYEQSCKCVKNLSIKTLRIFETFKVSIALWGECNAALKNW